MHKLNLISLRNPNRTRIDFEDSEENYQGLTTFLIEDHYYTTFL